MVIKIKNPVLKKKVFKKMNEYDNKAIACYKKGLMKKGQYYEKQSDRLYKNNYYKIFKVMR